MDLIFGGIEIQPAEGLIWSWKEAIDRLIAGLIFGLILGLILRLILIGLLIGLLMMLPFVLTDGFSGKQVEKHLMLSPNEGIHRSLKHGFSIGIAGLLIGLLYGFLGELLIGPPYQLPLALLGGLFGGIFGLFSGMELGLAATLQHYILRFWLARIGLFPQQAIPFLEDATARILLRRVGGGYRFTHRLLLEYFAGLDTTQPSSSSTSTHPTNVPSQLMP